MARTVVTGAAGFIGSQLAECLIDEGNEVLGVDCFSDHYSRALKELNLRKLEANSEFKLMELNLATANLRSIVSDADVIFHLAARPGVRNSWSEFDDYVESNIIATRAVFEAAAESSVRVVYASSSSVYGDAESLPSEEHQQLRPISPYGASKVMTEMLAGAYASSYGLDAVGLRYFTVYGPRQRPDMGVARFIESIVEGNPISVYGDGLQRRDMTYVDDVVAATLSAARLGRTGHVYNVASNAPRALLEILRELADVLERPLRLAHEDVKPGDVRDTWGSVVLAHDELGYEPKMSLRDGLTRQADEAARRREAVRAQRTETGSHRGNVEERAA